MSALHYFSQQKPRTSEGLLVFLHSNILLLHSVFFFFLIIQVPLPLVPLFYIEACLYHTQHTNFLSRWPGCKKKSPGWEASSSKRLTCGIVQKQGQTDSPILSPCKKQLSKLPTLRRQVAKISALKTTQSYKQCKTPRVCWKLIPGPGIGQTILVLTIADKIIEEVKIGGSLGCSDHALVEYVISRKMSLESEVELGPWTSGEQNSSCLRNDEITWETVLRDTGMEQSWQLFKDTFLGAQELSTPQHKKLRRGNRELSWLSKDQLVKLRW